MQSSKKSLWTSNQVEGNSCSGLERGATSSELRLLREFTRFSHKNQQEENLLLSLETTDEKQHRHIYSTLSNALVEEHKTRSPSQLLLACSLEEMDTKQEQL